MTLRQLLIDDLKRDEGYRRYPYKCSAGNLTIGYGHNLEKKGISDKEAEILLNDDIADAEMDLYKVFPDAELFSDNRRRAFVNMMFNLGIQGFRKFKKMIEAIKENDFDKPADEMLDSLWHKQVGKRAERLAAMVRK